MTTLSSSQVVTANSTSSYAETDLPGYLVFTLDVSAVSGTSPTLDVTVEWSSDGHVFAAHSSPDTFPQITAAEVTKLQMRARDHYYRLAYTVGGASPSFTVDAITDYSNAPDSEVSMGGGGGTPDPHTHDDRYYTEAEVDSLIAASAPPSDLTDGEATIARSNADGSALATFNGNLRLTYFTARKSGTYTKLRSASGNTAQVGATVAKMGIFKEEADGSLTLLAATANDTTLWSSTNTMYERATTVSFTLTKGERYAYGFVVNGATTNPKFCGANAGLPSVEYDVSPRVGAAVTGQSDMPSTIAVGSLENTFGGFYYGVCVP